MEDSDEVRERISTLHSSLQSYSVPGYQDLKRQLHHMRLIRAVRVYRTNRLYLAANGIEVRL